MPTKIKGKQLEDNTINKEKLSLVAPTVGKDPVTKAHFDARTINGKPLSSNVSLVSNDIPDLINVDNTSDVDKPISTATQTSLNRKLNYGTASDFQSWFDTNLSSFNLTDVQKEGLFKYDSTDTTTAQDNVMTLVKEGKRFKRQYDNFVSIKWFGAKGDYNPVTQTGTDDTAAFQAALNWAPNKGLALLIDEGNYLIKDALKPKKINDKKDYRLTLIGKGKGVTNIYGDTVTSALVGKNLLDFGFTSGDDTAWNASAIKIIDITFWAGKANRCIYADRVIDFELSTCTLNNGTIECLRVGSGNGDGNTFAAYVHRCYFGGSDFNGGINNACMQIHSGFAEIYNNVSDGGKYALLTSGNQMYIAGNTFEGSKYAGIHFSSTGGGGGSKIIGNTIRPYTGFDFNGQFNGELYGIYIESTSGGVSANTISGNQAFIPDPIVNDIVGNLSSTSGTLVPSPHAPYKITGVTSGTEGLLVGYNLSGNRVLLQKTTGTGFVTGETIIQSTSGASFVIGSFVVNSGNTLMLKGSSGYNSVVGNRFEGGTHIVRLESPGNILANNTLAGVRDGIYVSGSNSVITGNYISLFSGSGSYVAIKRVGSVSVLFDNNIYNGTLDGIAPQMFSNITTTNRNALTSSQKYSGLVLNDTTANKLSHYDGTNWSYLGPDRLISGEDGIIDGNLAGKSGSFTWGPASSNVISAYGTGFNIVGATNTGDANDSVGSWQQQLLFTTDGQFFWRQRIYSYGTWQPNVANTAWKIWDSKSFDLILAQANSPAATSTVAAGANPTKAEFDSLRADYLALKSSFDSLLAKMRTSKILNT